MNILVSSMKYRTIEQTAQIFKKLDPNTAITSYFIRELCNSNTDEIKVIKSGNKSLINISSLFQFLDIKCNENTEE